MATEVDLFGQIRVPAWKRPSNVTVGQRFVLQTERDMDEQLDHALHDARAARVALQVRGSAGEDRDVETTSARREPSTLKVRNTHHVSYHRCEPADAADGHDAGEDAAAEALAIVERSMRNNQYYSAALKSSLARDVRAMANIHFAKEGDADAKAGARDRSPSPNKRSRSPKKEMDRLLQREGERDRGRSPRLDHSAGQQDGEWGRGVSGRKTSPHKERAPASAVAVHARTTSSDGRREGEAGDKCMHAARDCGDGPPGQVQDGRSVHRARPTSASTTARRYHSLQFQADSLSSRARKEAERVGTGGGSGGAASIISGKSGMVSSGKEKAPIKTASSSTTIAGSRRVASATRVPLRQLQTSAAEQVARVIEKEELAGLRGKSYRGTPVPSSLVDEITPLSTQEEFQLSLESRQVERVTGKVVAEGGKLQDEEQFLWERQQQLERDLNELKRRQEAVRLEKLERQLQMEAERTLHSIQDELQVELQSRIKELLDEKERNMAECQVFQSDILAQIAHLQLMHDEAVVQGAQFEQQYGDHVECLHQEFKDKMTEKKRLIDASIAQQLAAESAASPQTQSSRHGRGRDL